jgi:hypothetical protein
MNRWQQGILCLPGDTRFTMNVRGIYTDTGGVRVGMSWTTRGPILPGLEKRVLYPGISEHGQMARGRQVG